MKPPRDGYKRQWVRCKRCKGIAFYDYLPFSLSTPLMSLPCGHDMGQRFNDAVTHISEAEALVSRLKFKDKYKERVLKSHGDLLNTFLTVDFLVVNTGDGAYSKVCHGWESMIQHVQESLIDGEPDENTLEILEDVHDMESWSHANGVPFFEWSKRFEDGTVSITRIME